MKANLILSAILHIAIVVAVMFVKPWRPLGPADDDFTNPIMITAISASDLPSAAPEEEIIVDEPVAPMIPPAMEEEEPDIPISDPTTKPEVEIDKPDPKPEPETPPKPEPEKPKETQKPVEPTQKPATSQPQEQTNEQPTGHDIEGQSGTGIAGATVTNAEFGRTYPFWFQLAYGKLSQNFSVPVMIDGRVQCEIYFEVIKSGRIISIEIVKPSGVPEFDQASKRAVENSSPLPPLPKKFLEEIIGVTVTFENSY